MFDLTTIPTHTITDARAIAYGAEVEGIDPEAEAILFADDTIADVAAAVKVAHYFGLSRESEWAADFISAHRYIRKHGVEAAQREVR